jgi:glycosyltransferase involved in cell wall biosynthesis
MQMSQMKRKILIGIPCLSRGGTEMQTLSVIRVLGKAGYRITVCCYHEFDTNVVAQFEQAGVRVVLLHIQRSDGLLALLFRLRRFFLEEQPDIVHVQYMAPGLIPIIAARFAGIKTVFATVHIAGSVAYGVKAKFLLRTAAWLCNAFICVSKGVEEFWFGDSLLLEPARIERGRRHFTIYNTIDFERIKATIDTTDSDLLRRELGIQPESPVVGIVGRLAEQKGHTFLLDAFAYVVAQFPSAIMLVVGDGPLRQQLEEQGRRLGIDRSIRWLGSQPQEEVFRCYTVMNIFAMPSLFEGFGLTAAEAMASGLPVVATSVDGLTEVVSHNETGLLVPPGDTKALANGIISLLGNTAMREMFGRNAHLRVRQNFSLETFSSAILSVYLQVSHD